MTLVIVIYNNFVCYVNVSILLKSMNGYVSLCFGMYILVNSKPYRLAAIVKNLGRIFGALSSCLLFTRI